ncbi:phage portal protein [Blastopirellula retiformator]|uniref:Phage portal protein, lambda family n=1 Tax=Blastopirellula retiformator TaxID=2527970 RepID=A0A5C5UYZ5_9BACT|nr:phage portal protein [Blastopirellula retiformator]TWT30707.1 Phage portal protein, lambda family [Blastopirellula retiformator]
MAKTTNNPTDYVREAQQLQARLQVHYLEQEVALLEQDASRPQRVVHESYVDMAPVRQGFTELPHGQAGPVMPDIASDRANGDFWPTFNTEWALSELRGAARALAQTSYGSGILGSLKSYIIRTGFDYAATAIRGQNTPDRLVAEVQRIVDELLSDNRWELDFEQELCEAERTDGEIILALEQDGGQVRIRRAEPSWLTEPADKEYLERRMGVASQLNWRYGIATDADDASRVHGYFIQWNADASAWNLYPSSRIVHIKGNTPRHVKRGLTDFYPVIVDLADAIALNRRMSKGAAIQASIAMIIEAVSGSGGLGIGGDSPVGGSLTRNDGGTGTRITSSGQYVSERRSDWHEGMVIDTKNKKFQAGPMGGTQAANFVQVLQAGLRSIGVRWQMPEYMISGDASNNNYASILEAGSPFVCRIEGEQEKLCKAYERMLWAVVRIACETGRLNLHRYGMTWKDLRRCVNLIVSATSPVIRKRGEDFTVDEKLYDKGLMSGDTLAAKYDLDPEEEREKGAKPQPAALPFGQPAATEVDPRISQARAAAQEALRLYGNGKGVHD